MDANLLAFPFDATQYEPFVGGFKVYEAGIYLMAITDMAPQMVRGSQTNGLLRVEYTIYSDSHRGEKFTEFLNLWNYDSEQAVEIAYRQLSSIAYAVGKLQVQNLVEFANLPMMVELDYTEAVQGGVDGMGRDIKPQPARNRVVRRSPYDQEQAAQAQPHRPMNPAMQPNQNAAQAASAPPMGSPMQNAQQAQQAAPTQPARQTPPPFAARGNGAAGAPQMPNQPAAMQQTVAAQMPGQQAVPPWAQPK